MNATVPGRISGQAFLVGKISNERSVTSREERGYVYKAGRVVVGREYRVKSIPVGLLPKTMAWTGSIPI
jgi:hypothetical protein